MFNEESQYMFEDVYIIRHRNSEPAPPEFMYYCGANPPISDVFACVNMSEVRWDPSSYNAYKIRSFDQVSRLYLCLKELGFKDLSVMKVVARLDPFDTDDIEKAAIKLKVADIIDTIDKEDIEFLSKCGVLDLTKLT